MANVLVIDDDRAVGEMVRRSLEKIGLNVLTVMKAVDGINSIRTESPEVVLLDIMLPGTSGLDVFQQIREIDRRLPIIFITAGSDSSTAIRAGGLELSSWAAIDSQNTRTQVNLSNHQYGISVNDSAFRFNDPRPANRR